MALRPVEEAPLLSDSSGRQFTLAEVLQVALDGLAVAVLMKGLGQPTPTQPVQLLLAFQFGSKHRQLGRFAEMFAADQAPVEHLQIMQLSEVVLG